VEVAVDPLHRRACGIGVGGHGTGAQSLRMTAYSSARVYCDRIDPLRGSAGHEKHTLNI
jgi:hypothetical protein